MEIEESLRQKKEIYAHLIDFIDSVDNCDDYFHSFTQILDQQYIVQKKDSIIEFFQLISKIESNHHRMADFYDKLEKIFRYVFQKSDLIISNSDLIDIYKSNKKILLLLLEKEFLKPDKKDINLIISKADLNGFQYGHYLYGGLKKYFEENERKNIEKMILIKYKEENIESFEKKCQIGENDSYICSLIRQDSIDEFISYVNQTNYSLTNCIKPSIFETNTFLMRKEISLIEYASFFSSIQVIQYLKNNQIEFTNSIFLYSIHSNNAELIEMLLENEKVTNTILDDKNKIQNVFIESIKCHHNEIANYIEENLLEKRFDNESFISSVIESRNYYYLPDDITNKSGFTLSQISFLITTITIPSSFTSIGYYEFKDCSSLKEIKIPSSVKSIGKGCFSGCSSLKIISIPQKIEIIDDETFKCCSSLEQISIPSSVKTIGNNAFKGCSHLKEITLPSSINSIGKGCFCGCISLTTFSIPPSVKSIEDETFKDCINLMEINIHSKIKSIGKFAFNRCSSLIKIEIPPSVNLIGAYAFRCCSSLKSFDIPSSVKSIESNLFEKCTSLSKISIPSSVESIGDGAFNLCTSLVEISIPKSVVSIQKKAFFGCSSLKILKLPNSFQSMDFDNQSARIIYYN